MNKTIPKLIGDSIKSITPLNKPSSKIFHLEVTDKPEVFNPGDIIHSWGYGWGITDENGKMIYLQDDIKEYNRLIDKYK
jgi:hypothetical protein